MNTGRLKVMIRIMQDVMCGFSLQCLATSYVDVHCGCHQGGLCGRRMWPSTQNGTWSVLLSSRTG
jgi:hypothetical protein